jgi:hypothetical protein
MAYMAIGKWVGSGVKIVMASPGERASIACLYASGSRWSFGGNESNEVSRPL